MSNILKTLRTVVGDNMLEKIIIDGFLVFAITLIITKSVMMEAKRKFVTDHFNQAKAADQKGLSYIIHHWWYSMHTCPMCLGFWIAMIVGLFDTGSFITLWFTVFGLNWLLHCIESFLLGRV